MVLSIIEVLSKLNDWVGSDIFILLCICTGLYFTIRTRFLQVRYLKDMVQLLFKEKKAEEGGVTSFQAFAMALAGRVGTGNIAGVATAIAMGGPGAVFWMWVIAFLGAATAYVEATLGQIYKVKIDGNFTGGPAYYIEKGMGVKWYAILFAIVALCSCALFLPGIQSNSIADSMHEAFAVKHWMVGIGVAFFLAFIIWGGVKRIAKASEILVSVMAGGYILMALIIIIINFREVPDVISLIVRSALGADATFGGIVGYAVTWGVKRGLYSNEAGQGSAPHAAAAASTKHPAQQGLVQAFSVYIDTLLVCTATAFMILFTGQYNVKNPQGGFIVENIPNVQEGAVFTQQAIATFFPSFAHGFVAISLFFFAFTTCMAYYYIAESNLKYVVKKNNKLFLNILRVVFLISVFIGTITTGGVSWMLGDIGVGLMAWVNFIAILILQKPALRALKDYQAKKKTKNPMYFDPTEIGITNADEWEKRE